MKLLLMFCPYCGSKDVAETNRIEDDIIELISGCCLTCEENFVIQRVVNKEYEVYIHSTLDPRD